MIKGTIHKEDRPHQPLDTLTTKRLIYIKRTSEVSAGINDRFLKFLFSHSLLLQSLPFAAVS